MEHRSKHGPSIDLQAAAPLPPAATLAAILDCPGEFGAAVRGGRAYSQRLLQGAAARPRPPHKITSDLVTGGSKASVLASPSL